MAPTTRIIKPHGPLLGDDDMPQSAKRNEGGAVAASSSTQSVRNGKVGGSSPSWVGVGCYEEVEEGRTERFEMKKKWDRKFFDYQHDTLTT